MAVSIDDQAPSIFFNGGFFWNLPPVTSNAERRLRDDAEYHSRWKQSFTSDSFMESVNGGNGRRPAAQFHQSNSLLHRSKQF